jgi:hypothetical protein
MHYSSGPGVISHPLPEVNFLMVEIPSPKPYIFMIRVTRQIKCLIAKALRVGISTIKKFTSGREWGMTSGA